MKQEVSGPGKGWANSWGLNQSQPLADMAFAKSDCARVPSQREIPRRRLPRSSSELLWGKNKNEKHFTSWETRMKLPPHPVRSLTPSKYTKDEAGCVRVEFIPSTKTSLKFLEKIFRLIYRRNGVLVFFIFIFVSFCCKRENVVEERETTGAPAVVHANTHRHTRTSCTITHFLCPG